MSSVPNGLVLFEGPSALDGEPIAVIINGLHGSSNRKTGDMLQGWILRSDIDPIQATKTGQDSSVCGQCPLRGNVLDGHNRGRVCYVGLPRGPQDVYQAYRRGRYPRFDPTKHKHPLKDRKLRIGAYGDPCAAPYAVWSRLVRVVADSVGYTHIWRDRRFWRFRSLCMASCETLDDARHAQSLGWRTFRTLHDAFEISLQHEIHCPASDEAGQRTQCDRCLFCDGQGCTLSRIAKPRKGVAIVVHGPSGVVANYKKLVPTVLTGQASIQTIQVSATST